MSIPAINLDFCSEPVNLHCPICGQIIFALGIQQKSCSHLLFLGDSACESWAWQPGHYAQKFERRLQQEYEKASKKGFYGSQENYIATVRANKAATIATEIISKKSAFKLSISTSDIGCGGMHNGTIHAIFDYLPEGNKLISELTIL